MGVLDDFAELADTFVEEFDNGVDGGTGGLALYIRRRVGSTFDPATQVRAASLSDSYAIAKWSRTKPAIALVPSASGVARRFEEFFIVFTAADLAASGWPGAAPDETAELLVGANGASGIYPVIDCERVMKEKGWRVRVRIDRGTAT